MPYITYKDREIFYADQGSGPCLVYVHEWYASSLSFRKLNQKYLDKKLRVISLDLPGYGNSEFVEGLQFADFSNILEALLGHLKIERCSLMGFCLGAAIILDFYQKFPDRVRTLILIEPLLKFPIILIPLLIPGFGVAFLKHLAKSRFLFSLVGSQLTGGKKQMNNHIFKSLVRNDTRISEQYLHLLFKKNHQSDFRKLDVDIRENCLCISGKNTNIFFRKHTASLIRHFKIHDAVVLDNTGHLVLTERPADIAGIILNYLE